MTPGTVRLGLFAWGNRRGLGRLLLLATAAALGLPVALALLAVAVASTSVAPPMGDSRPLSAWVVTQPYGCTGLGLEPRRGPCPHFHFGIDLAAPLGAPVVAVADGQAEIFPPAGIGGGYGVHIVVHHRGGLDTMYAHLADTAVGSGQQLGAGTLLGHEGSTGLSTGPHLHFEVREAGVAVDPVSVFPGIFGPEGQPR
ncbi:MAG: M23 family metallopeptidase [Candidatus Dormibacteraeota bacterium]|nr:M23 family metallopeptidase [Candidatus Dormibacteraeota bacterium]